MDSDSSPIAPPSPSPDRELPAALPSPGPVADAAAEGSEEPAGEVLDFDPVPTRARRDGWTPEKQREFVEALADTGVVRVAAARVGMTEQSVNRLRRRSDARAFDLACEAAHRFGARRLLSVAWERAIEGVPRRHYWRGEMVGEDRVYDNRLLIHLLGKAEPHLQPAEDSMRVAANWNVAMEALAEGRPFEEVEALSPEHGPADLFEPIGPNDIWDEDDEWWTSLPPPQGFDGFEQGRWGEPGYRRTLDRDEAKVVESLEAEDREEEIALACERRDALFGFHGGLGGSGSPPLSSRTFEPSERPGTAFPPSGDMP